MLKTYIFLSIVCLLLVSCSSSGPSEQTKPPVATTQVEKTQNAPLPSSAAPNYNLENSKILAYKMELPKLAARPAPASPPVAAIPESYYRYNQTVKIITKEAAATAKAKYIKPAKPKVGPEDIMAQLYKAAMVFTLPEVANIAEEIRAELTIDPNKTLEELTQSTTGDIRAREDIRVSRILVAKLIAPELAVTPITPEEQALAATEPTKWQWDIKPREPGIFTANLVITALVKVDDKSTVHNLKTFTKELSIEIRPEQLIMSWIKKYWQWLVTSILVPLAGWIYKTKFSKRDSD